MTDFLWQKDATEVDDRIMAFMAGGHQPGRGEFGDPIDRGLDFLIASVAPSSDSSAARTLSVTCATRVAPVMTLPSRSHFGSACTSTQASSRGTVKKASAASAMATLK